MKILALVHRVPFPPNKGEKIRAFNQLKFLREQGHIIDLCTFADDPEDMKYHGDLLKYCRTVRIVSKPKKLNTVRSIGALPTALPLSVGFYRSVRMSFIVRDLLRRNNYDIIFCYSSPMAEFVRNRHLPFPAPARVMDFVDVDSDKWQQYAERKTQPMRTVYQIEAKLLARYERTIAEEFDASTLVSEEEARTFRQVAPKANFIESVPNGVDTVFFGETVRTPSEQSSPIFVFVGQMDYFANVDGVKYFAEDVFPAVKRRFPEAKFQIVGRAPTPEVTQLKNIDGVEVTGGVPDIRDYLGQGTIMVAPLRIARGIQNKVLEAMAARIPVVAAPAAFAGIEGVPGKHALVCDTAEKYSKALIELVENPDKQADLAREARTLVEEQYAWEPAMKKLEDIFAREIQTKRHSAQRD
ncbi:MAG: TIGR03087 family PEP-CTERM/XrtA system glycosyltransferase [Myxococcota bacterium]|nr:TIGR03087 family PEP-CTERM/XrtA system glycosyltransferase [Myxococcota bacterium]